MLCIVGASWGTELWSSDWPADASSPADILTLGDSVVEVMLGVYAVDAAELEAERGEVLRCISRLLSEGPLPYPLVIGARRAPAVEE